MKSRSHWVFEITKLDRKWATKSQTNKQGHKQPKINVFLVLETVSCQQTLINSYINKMSVRPCIGLSVGLFVYGSIFCISWSNDCPVSIHCNFDVQSIAHLFHHGFPNHRQRVCLSFFCLSIFHVFRVWPGANKYTYRIAPNINFSTKSDVLE